MSPLFEKLGINLTIKCWGYKHVGSASQFSPRVCTAKLGCYTLGGEDASEDV